MRRLPLLLLVLTLPLLTPASLPAEEAPKGSRVVISEAHRYALRARLDVRFTQETLGSALASIQEALEERVQFVVEPSVKDVVLPTITVNGASTLELLHLMGTMLKGVQARVAMGSEFLPPWDVMDQGEESQAAWWGEPAKTQIVLVGLIPDEDMDREYQRVLRIYPMGELMSDYELAIDDIATAVETAWEVAPIGHVATLKYHEQTKLLICYGTKRHLMLVDQVIEGITGRAPSESEVVTAAQAQERRSEQERQLKTVHNELQQLRREHAKTLRQATSLQAEIKALKAQIATLQSLVRPK